MPIDNPSTLVEECVTKIYLVCEAKFCIRFKKTGEFDRLRRELLASFQRGDGMSSFMNRVEDIARQKLDSDQRLHYMPPETVHRELAQELDRYPIVERAVADVRMLSDQSFTTGIRTSVQKILREDRGKASKSQKSLDGIIGDPQPSASRLSQSSIPERAAIRKGLAIDLQRPESPPNSRSQSPDSMKMSTPEPPSVSTSNGVANMPA